jgi:hypothetical protein
MNRFFAGFILGSSLIACAASPVWPYRFYHLSGNNFAGTLLGPTDKDDIPFERCRPVNGKQQCVVVQYPELTALISDYKKTKSDLIACQKGR